MAASLSVVVLSWNTCDLLRACLQALVDDHPGPEREILVVDNASDDDSVDMVRREFPQFRLIVNDDNLLYSEGNNVGARAATGHYVCLLNSDTEVRPGALEQLCTFLDEHDDYGLVGPRFVYPDGRLQKACRRIPGLSVPLWEWSWLRRTRWARRAADHASMADFDHASSQDVEQPLGACVVLRLAEYRQLEGLDPKLSLFFNDVDICLRLAKNGRRIHYLVEPEVLHHLGASTKRRGEEFGNAIWHRNRIAFYRKHHGWWGGALIAGTVRLSAMGMFCRILLGRRSWADKRAALGRLRSFRKRSLART
ncbi:MAG: glycosyltransferase family 2 protein [Planctomycetota bacterium]